MKNAVLVFIFVLCSTSFFGQTLVRYGNQQITKQEFLTAYKKNNAKGKPSDKAYRDYLNLYIRYRLKVKAAYDMRLDTVAEQRTELQNFRAQIIDQYINDENSLNGMAREAFIRSQKDLRISYIFVAAPKNALPADTLKAWQKIQQAIQELRAGKDFSETAVKYSEDPFVKNNQGDIGYITVFDLPYIMETVAYQTSSGKFSSVFRTDGGYIILKKTGERPGRGRIHIAQILLIFPYQATEQEKNQTKLRADSIYKAIIGGSDFGELARKFSGDNLSYQLGGTLPEFGIGKYEPGFENTAFGLKKDGEVSLPYASSFGYHIIRRIGLKPVPAISSQKILDELKEKIKSDPRVKVSRKQMLSTILKQTHYKPLVAFDNRFWAYTDSVLNNKLPKSGPDLNDHTALFQIGDKKYLMFDWTTYRKSLKSAPNLINGKTREEIFDLYRQRVAFDYYKEHLENYNKDFAAQVNEFRDGNLLFSVMQLQIWNRTASDSVGLKKYFNANEKSYWWKPGAQAIVFNSGNMNTAGKLKSRLTGDIKNWKKIVDSFGGLVQADSGRFEQKQIPGNTRVTEGSFTEMITNADKSIQFAYILHVLNETSPRTFEEARGMVMNDYQNKLEDQWIVELKRRYPVKINEAVFKTLPK